MPAATALCPPAKRVENVASGPAREYRSEPALGFEQVERAGDALCRKQRRLHAVLGDQRVGDVLCRGNATLAHRDRRRSARYAERNAVRELVVGQPHQPAGDGRRDHAGNADAVPHRIRIHQCFAAAVDFVREHDRGEKIASGRTGELRGGERDRDIVARVAAAGAALRVRAHHIVVEIEDADQRAVGKHRARRAHAMGMAEHRALRFLTERVERRQHRTGAVIIQRGKTAAERIEQQELGLLDGALRKIRGPQCREPCRKPLDGAFV
jgi:hypothetical protein